MASSFPAAPRFVAVVIPIQRVAEILDRPELAGRRAKKLEQIR